jgi:hypothetical protein
MLGSLGLLRSLSALGRAAPKTAAERMSTRKFIQRGLKRLDSGTQQFFSTLKAREDAKVKAAQEERAAQIAMFFSQYLPEPVNYKKEKEVVAAFVMGASKAHGNMETDGFRLTIGGRTVAERKDVSSKFVTVCPGEFNEDKTSRRAANAALDILGAGIRVDDRSSQDRDADGHAFLHPRGHGGRIVSSNRCYQVEVNSKIRSAAVRALTKLSADAGAANLVYGPVQTQAEVRAEAKAAMFPGKKRLTKKETRELKALIKGRIEELKEKNKAVKAAMKQQEKLERQAAMRDEISERAGDLMGLRRRRRHHR